MKRAAIYLRVSTDSQTVENQRADLMKLADLRQWDVVETYADEGISGAAGREKRPGLDGLLKDAKRRRFDIVVVWSIDRLGRSTAAVATALEEFSASGVDLFAFRESMDTSTAHGRAMLEMAAVFGRLEREMIRERVKAGIARVQAEQALGPRPGKKLIGRPKVSTDIEAKIRASSADGKGKLKIARELGVGVGTVARVLCAAQLA